MVRVRGISTPVFGSMIAAEPRSKPTVPHVYVPVGEGVAEVVGVDETDEVGEDEGLPLRLTDMKVLP